MRKVLCALAITLLASGCGDSGDDGAKSTTSTTGEVSDGVPASIGGVIDGAITNAAGDTMYPVLGAPSLLFDLAVPWRLQASTESGATCLTFNKGHFYAMLNQCPSLIISLRELSNEQLATAIEEDSG